LDEDIWGLYTEKDEDDDTRSVLDEVDQLVSIARSASIVTQEDIVPKPPKKGGKKK